MAQIDYFLKFADEATAKTQLAQYLNNGEWPADYCIPGIKIWRASQDVTTGSGTDIDPFITTHTYLPGFFILVSLKTVVPALRDAAPVQVVLDRDKAKIRQAGAVIKSNVSNAILQDFVISPVFAGSDIPYGNMN